MNAAHTATRAVHARALEQLDFSDTRDFDDVQRGFVGTLPDAHFLTSRGEVAWTMRDHAFVAGDAPATVHPSLWRMARLNTVHGLFKVTERIYRCAGSAWRT